MFKDLKVEVKRLYKPKFSKALASSMKIFIASVAGGVLISLFDLGISSVVDLIVGM